MFEEGKDCGFIFLVANKKIEQRFAESNGRFYNPVQGLVIEDGICRSDRFEFYLIPHTGPTGLQCPMRYDVIEYENWNGAEPLNPKDLYDLTFNLSFGFFNY